MTSHAAVLDRFVDRGRPLKGKHVYADSDTVYSYGRHFPMAVANDERNLFIVNGDRWGSITSGHQRNLRGALTRNSDYDQVIIPFSAMSAAGIEPKSITVIEKGLEINESGCITCDVTFPPHSDTAYQHECEFGRYSDLVNKHETWNKHLLAPSLITATRIWIEIDPESKYCGRCGLDHDSEHFSMNGWKHDRTPGTKRMEAKVYLLSGFDETARAWGGGYFLSQLPHAVKSIEEAYTALAPKPVLCAIHAGVYVKRQGDIFAVPNSELTTRRLNKIGKRLPIQRTVTTTLKDWNNEDWKTVTEPEFFNIGDQSLPVYEPNSYKFHKNGYRPQLLGTNHYATEAYQVERRGVIETWARGSLYHIPTGRPADHKVIKLGKIWHRIYRNTAIGSWSPDVRSGGRVD